MSTETPTRLNTETTTRLKTETPTRRDTSWSKKKSKPYAKHKNSFAKNKSSFAKHNSRSRDRKPEPVKVKMPESFDVPEGNAFSQCNLMQELVYTLHEKGYKKPTEIQAKAIPALLNGRDILGGSQTGTGKTASFILPILHRLSQNEPEKNRNIRALVLTPTRELASQVADSAEAYSKYLPIQSAAVFGGVSMHAQIHKLRRGVDLLIATPGRLLDHVRQRTIDLSNVEYLVLDEADRMLDMGFIDDIKIILNCLKPERQSALFSATYSSKIKSLAKELLKNPEWIEASRENTVPKNVLEQAYPVDQARKKDLLSEIIGKENWQQVLVFTRTKHGADRLCKQLEEDGLTATTIHSNKSQHARSRALAAFKQGTVRILVATDVAARGLDINNLPHVVNFDLPNVPEDYVHRIGRTGRAGKHGTAISLVSNGEIKFLRSIERLLNYKIKSIVLPGYEQTKRYQKRDHASDRQKSDYKSNNRQRSNERASNDRAFSKGDKRQNGGSWADKRQNSGSWADKRQNGGSSNDRRQDGGSWSDKRQNGGSSNDRRQNGGSWGDKRQNSGSSNDRRQDGGSWADKRQNSGSSNDRRQNGGSWADKRQNSGSSNDRRQNDGSWADKRQNSGSSNDRRQNSGISNDRRQNGGSWAGKPGDKKNAWQKNRPTEGGYADTKDRPKKETVY